MDDFGDGGVPFLIHFDLPRHELPLDAFIVTAESAVDIARTINEEVFSGALALEVVVLPPEEGTFLARLRIGVVHVGVLLGTALAGGPLGEFSTGFVAGLTDQHPEEWGKELGASMQGAFEALFNLNEADETRCRAGALVTAAAVKWLLEADNDHLKALGITEVVPGALEAKTRFYEGCESVFDLRGIGFDKEPYFPIRREDFRRLGSPTPREHEPEWQLAIADIKVTSPNWNKSDHNRTWKAMDKSGNLRVFHVLDEQFWGRIIRGELETRINDSMRVQWVYQQGPNGPKNLKVLSVLEFNGMRVSPPKSDAEIRTLISRFVRVENDEPSLFDEDDDGTVH